MIILLHSPQLPENLGAVARVMGNFGLSSLRLITSHVLPSDAKAIATSAGAEDILASAKIYGSLSEATADLPLLYGTCADVRQGIRHYETPESAMKKAIQMREASSSFGILFGCEKSGLTQEDLSHCQGTIQIPVEPSFSSMNLSHAVGIIAYEWFKAIKNPLPFQVFGKTEPSTQKEKEAFFSFLIKALDDVDYWRVPSKKAQMAENLANLFFRMDLTHQEIQTLFGVIESLRNPRR